MKDIKVAIAHDWLTGMRGGEKCLDVFCELFPKATVFTLMHIKGSVSPTIEKMSIRTSFIDKIPNISKNYRWFLPLFPKAIESFDLTGYDLVISSSHCVAKGVKVHPGALHICYCYTPMRYAWKFFDEYFSGENRIKRWVIARILNNLKKWDILTNKRVDYFISISDNIKGRIRLYYNRDADTIYPPVDVVVETDRIIEEEYYLVVSALVPYKRVDLAVKAFNESGRKLVVIGDGEGSKRLKEIAKKNIEFLGWSDEKTLKQYYSSCRALIFPGEEDFGIIPVEAQSFGKPVIAYGRGGILETVVPLSDAEGKDPTGIFFKEQTEASLNEAIDIFERNRDKFKPESIKANTVRFGRERFKKEIREYIEGKWDEYSKD